MPVNFDNSIESFIENGFTREQSEHLSRLSDARDSMTNKKQAPCTENMLQQYKQRINELSDEIDFYWQKYQNENSDRYE